MVGAQRNSEFQGRNMDIFTNRVIIHVWTLFYTILGDLILPTQNYVAIGPLEGFL